MSNYYPMWWDTTVTVYTKYENSDTKLITWYKTIIDGCFFKSTQARVQFSTNSIESPSLICRIPKQDNYISKLEWDRIDISLIPNVFSIGAGDIIIKGAVDDYINEYESGHRSSDLLTKYRAYDMALVVKSVTVDVGIGRVDEHYCIRG